MIVGEWAVLEVGNPCIVAAINKRVRATIEPRSAAGSFLHAPEFGISDVALQIDREEFAYSSEVSDEKKSKLVYVKSALDAAARYLGDIPPFSLTTDSSAAVSIRDGERVKVGFGSSASISVATIGALFALVGRDISANDERMRIFKLAALSHYLAQGKLASAFDVVAAAYGGVVHYSRFDSIWLLERVEKIGLRNAVDETWPGLVIETLEIPKDLHLLIGFVGKSASTGSMVREMERFKNSSNKEYSRIYNSIADVVRETVSAWKRRDRNGISEGLHENRRFLGELTEKSGLPIEISSLKHLAELANEHGAVGKLSGAGGGDCGIAICFDENIATRVRKAWSEAEIEPIEATIDPDGVRIASH